MARKVAQKKMSAGAVKAMKQTAFGGEPVLKKGYSQIELVTAYNWYNVMYDSDEAVKFIIEYLEDGAFSKDLIAGVKKVRSFELRTIGWTLRMALNGSQIDFLVVKKVMDRLRDLVAKAEKPKEEVKVVKTSTAPSAFELAVAELDAQFDAFVKNGESKFVATTWMNDQKLGPTTLKAINAYYARVADELYEAINGKDEQVKEAYSCFKKPMLRGMLGFVTSIMDATVEKQAVNEAKKVRKPRKKKVKTPDQLTKAVKYLAKAEAFNLTSVAPASIVGATQVWLFNVKYRSLAVINAAGAGGLTVKGSTIVNFDENTSISKRVRKPLPVLKNLLEGGKVTVRKLMEQINTNETKATGRINKDTVIVRVLK